jgi:hypothetical protein
MIRRYKNEDYGTLKEWWVAQNWPPVPEDNLPQMGYVVEDICAGFLYQTDSKCAILEWIISNPNSDSTKRDKALDLLIKTILEETRNLGYQTILSWISHPRLMTRFLKHDFKPTETATVFVRLLEK